MRTVAYKRKAQFKNIIETHIGILFVKPNRFGGKDMNVIHPIQDGVVWMGIMHTNAFEIRDIVIGEDIIDSSTRKPFNFNI